MLTKEQITKEKKFQSAEELLAYAKETGHGLTEEKAKALFAQLHPNNREVSDDELENVSGGCNEETPWQCPDYCHLEGKSYNPSDCTTCSEYILRQYRYREY